LGISIDVGYPVAHEVTGKSDIGDSRFSVHTAKASLHVCTINVLIRVSAEAFTVSNSIITFLEELASVDRIVRIKLVRD
jgi:hypothetical protein